MAKLLFFLPIPFNESQLQKNYTLHFSVQAGGPVDDNMLITELCAVHLNED